MNALGKALFGAAVLAMTAGTASAAVVCNDEGDCWRVRDRPTYGPDVRLRIHPDNWRWERQRRDHYRWREPGRGHGYWRNGAWIMIR
jgi:hypothetical protein